MKYLNYLNELKNETFLVAKTPKVFIEMCEDLFYYLNFLKIMIFTYNALIILAFSIFVYFLSITLSLIFLVLSFPFSLILLYHYKKEKNILTPFYLLCYSQLSKK